MKTQVLSFESREQKTLLILGSLVLVLIGLYIYFMNTGVSNITAFKAAEEKTATLSSEVSSLESEYMALSSEKVSLAYAYSLGFKDVTSADIAYLVIGTKPTLLSLR